MPRLYFITAGSVLYHGSSGLRETLGPGRCWGANDVLSLQSDRSAFRAVAASYLHVQWIGAQKLRDLRFEHPEPFRHLRLWAMLRDVASYLVSSMHKMPAAFSLADVERSDGSRPAISLREWGEDDPLRAVLVVGNHERVVRFREKDRAAVERSLFGPLQVESIEGSQVGGTVRLQDGRTFPNPRLIDVDGPGPNGASTAAATKEIDWTQAMLRDSSTSGLWKLKRAIDVALEERMMTSERIVASMQRAIMQADDKLTA